jgi:hypothetical protein
LINSWYWFACLVQPGVRSQPHIQPWVALPFLCQVSEAIQTLEKLAAKIALHPKLLSRFQNILQVFVEYAIHIKLGTRIQLNIIFAWD